MIGLGLDAVEVDRFRVVLKRRPSIVERLFTANERADMAGRADPVPGYAARFAAKEATMKAFGVGIGAVHFSDIEVRSEESGAPRLVLYGRAEKLAEQRGVRELAISLTHSNELAAAVVLLFVKPVLSTAEMAAVDRAAIELEPIEALIARAGFAVARHALSVLGTAYGKVVIVICGKGHNGDDGRVAARLLAARGVRVEVIDVATAPEQLPSCDLVIDAAFGTGFRGSYDAPRPPAGAAVLAVDVPSGLNADTGTSSRGAARADVTVTMGALKPGLLFGQGPELSGRLVVEPIDLPIGESTQHLVEDDDLVRWLSPKPREAHKWQAAVLVLAGAPGTRGAAALCCLGASHAGAGMVRLGSPGAFGKTALPAEIVEVELPATDFADAALSELERCKALVLGPGLGHTPVVADAVRKLLAGARVPVLLDADALNSLGRLDGADELFRDRPAATVLTPHDGEFARLFGSPPGEDRLLAARELAARCGAIVLLKGPTTIVAEPTGEVLFVTAGSPALATAGSGDVLSGIIGAFLARGVPAARAAALGAHVHGRAAHSDKGEGLVASDLPDLVARTITALRDA